MIRLKPTHAAGVVREVMESAMQMARMALQGLGTSLEEIDRAEQLYRSRDKERLSKQIETGDIKSARDRILTQPIRKDT